MTRWGSWALCVLLGLGSTCGCGGRSSLPFGAAEGVDDDAPSLRAGASSGGGDRANALGGAPASGGSTAGHGGGNIAQGGNVPVGGSEIGGAGAGGSGGEAGASDRDWYVDPVIGRDANPGTRAMPFKTLTHAAEVAAAPGTVWLVRGRFDAAGEPLLEWVDDEAADSTCGALSGIMIPEGVDVRGLSAEAVSISVRGRHGLCARGSNFSNISFERAASDGRLLELDGGSAELRAVSFQNFDGPITDLDSTVGAVPVLILRGQSSVDWIAEPARQTLGRGSVASMKDRARLRVVGGEFGIFPSNGAVAQRVFLAVDAAALQLSGVTLRGDTEHNHEAVLAYGEDPLVLPSVSFTDNSLVEGFTMGCRFARNARVSVADSEFASQSSWALAGIPIGSKDTQSSLRIERSIIRESAVGVFMAGLNGSIEIADSLFEGNGSGVAASVNSLSIRDTRLVGSRYYGIQVGAQSFTMRRTSFQRNGGGLALGSRVLRADLGSASDPGQNRFSSTGQLEHNGPNLSVGCNNDCFVNASGNTWDPLEQGADDSGHYPAPVGEPWDVTSGSGANYNISSTATLRLAE